MLRYALPLALIGFLVSSCNKETVSVTNPAKAKEISDPNLQRKIWDKGQEVPAVGIYNSTMDVLNFLFSHKLIGPGTLIGYDDWGDTELWTAGESRAHKEIMEKYDVACAQLFSWGERPLIRKLFVVVRVGR